MNEELKYPSLESTKSVLRKIGVDYSSRIDEYDQDFEYTSCRVEELNAYLELYELNGTTLKEKRVLGCFFFECLNDFLQSEQNPHKLQSQIFTLLFRDIEIHKNEIDYWSDISDPDSENWWVITSEILKWKSSK